MKINIELNNEEELIRFTYLMDREKNELASVLFYQYKSKYEDAMLMLEKAQAKLAESPDSNKKYYAIEIDKSDSPFVFSVRAVNILKAEKIFTIGELLETSESALKKMPNMGNKTIKEIKEELAKNNLYLRA